MIYILQERYNGKMQVSFSTTGIFDLDRCEKYINYVLDAGFNSIMLDLDVFYSKFDLEDYGTQKRTYSLQRLRQRFDRFVNQCSDYGICFESMRAPRLKWDTKRTDLNELLLQIGKECIAAGEKIGCRNIIIQPLFSGIDKLDEWKVNYWFYLELGRMARDKKIYILLENQCCNINGHLVRGICSDYTAATLIDELNDKLGGEVFGFCLNTGTCSLCKQDMGEMAAELAGRVKAVLIRECDGIHEGSRLPFTGRDAMGESVDWNRLVRGLRGIEFGGDLIMDAEDTLRGFSPLLRAQIYPVIRSVAVFLKWQIEMEKQLKKYPSIVLFGAGNMCKNYMEYYGEQYPPLFICDNNSKLWGKEIYGVEVKNPEELKRMPNGIGVFICNACYQEIERQLKDMNVENIEYFNDEYVMVNEKNDKLV